MYLYLSIYLSLSLSPSVYAYSRKLSVRSYLHLPEQATNRSRKRSSAEPLKQPLRQPVSRGLDGRQSCAAINKPRGQGCERATVRRYYRGLNNYLYHFGGFLIMIIV